MPRSRLRPSYGCLIKTAAAFRQYFYISLFLVVFYMENSSVQRRRHQIINELMARHTENIAEAAINLWEQMATQIISIVGEGGFNSLYVRSLLLTQSTFPWLSADLPPSPSGQRFAGLKKSFEGQSPVQAGKANGLLLVTFTDILALLIGERLTTGILRSAWGDDALDGPNKEFNT